MMANFNSIHLLLFLAFVFSIPKVVRGKGTLEISLNKYTELANDISDKCIKLCVTTSPSGFPRCNLNTSDDTAYVFGMRTVKTNIFGYPHPVKHTFKFNEWEDNSELRVTVWKLRAGQLVSDCATIGPTNSTSHGEAHTIIPRLYYKSFPIPTNKWMLNVITQIQCDVKPKGCLLPCVARDNSTGHYTCHDGNKKCLPRWYGRNCLKTCVKPNDPPGNYKCSKTGEKGCLTNWFGENCTTFCDLTSSTYKCDQTGKKSCLENWFGENCSKFCDNSSKRYTCDNTGQKKCILTNYYGENCSTFCNSSAPTYNCGENGEKICFKNWFNQNCEHFCDSKAKTYLCDGEGRRVCLQHWYGEECSEYCNNSAAHYKCNDRGEKICLRDWYGPDCEGFCNNSAAHYKCNDRGEKICLKDWYGPNCTKYCNNSAAHYKCNDRGEKRCLRDWYGPNCTKFCNSDERFRCDVNGNKTCMRNWFGRNCSKHCESVPSRYQCDVNGNKSCVEDLYGDECDIHCKAITDTFGFCSRRNEEVEGGVNAGCPEGWKDTNCLKECVNENKEIKAHKGKCEASKRKASICSNDTAMGNNDQCPFIKTANIGASSSNDVSNMKLYGSLFGAFSLMLIITTIIVVYVSVRKKKATTTTPFYENPQEINQEVFARDFNRAELTLNIDQLMMRRQSDTEGLGYDNGGMVENPLYDSRKPNMSNMRAVVPYNKPLPKCPVSNASDVFSMSNTEV